MPRQYNPSLLIVAKGAAAKDKASAWQFVESSHVMREMGSATAGLVTAEEDDEKEPKVKHGPNLWDVDPRDLARLAAKDIPDPAKMKPQERYEELLRFFDPAKLRELKKPKTELKGGEKKWAGNKHSIGLQNILDVMAHAKPEDHVRFGDWYDKAHESCDKLAKQYSMPLDVTVGMVAATSQGTLWEENIKLAEFFISGGKSMPPVGYDKVKITDNNRAKVERVLDGDFSAIESSKFNRFFNSILDPAATRDIVVIDTHAIGIWYGRRIGAQSLQKPTNAMWAAINRDYTYAAKSEGITPQSCQAISWSCWRQLPPSYVAENLKSHEGTPHPEVEFLRDMYPTLYPIAPGKKSTWRYHWGVDPAAHLDPKDWEHLTEQYGTDIYKYYGFNRAAWEDFLKACPKWKELLEEAGSHGEEPGQEALSKLKAKAVLLSTAANLLDG